jgi:biotin synthase
MGETPEQRLELAVEARALGISCLPVNILNPQPGTPLRTAAASLPWKIVRTVAVFRFILPRGTIKIAGGRQINLRDLQALALAAGANGIILEII